MALAGSAYCIPSLCKDSAAASACSAEDPYSKGVVSDECYQLAGPYAQVWSTEGGPCFNINSKEDVPAECKQAVGLPCGSARRRSSSASPSPVPPASSDTRNLHTHWLCGRGLPTPNAKPNTAVYGPCVATLFDNLQMTGLPSQEEPGFAGVALQLDVLKVDTYGQTILR